MNIRDYIRPIITGLVGIGLVILVIVFLVKTIGGNGGAKPQHQVDVTDYAGMPSAVTLLSDAPTNIDQDHRQVRITVTQSENEVDIIQGYQGNVIDTRTYPSNQAAYTVFLQSLKLMNFSKGDNNPDLKDYSGYCPRGNRFVFTFNDGSTDLFSYWTTSCGQGTYKGERSATLNLFRNQIPQSDFSALTNNIATGF